jgi:predicted  nucleic acid-binding Zn-ribbon protein
MAVKDVGPSCPECGKDMFLNVARNGNSGRDANFKKPIAMYSIAPETPEQYEALARAGASFNEDQAPLAHNRAEKKRLMEVAGHVEMS